MCDDRRTLIREARKYLEASWHATEDGRYDTLQQWARDILEPLAAAGDLEAEFLLGHFDDISAFTPEELRTHEIEWLRKGAAAGDRSARFRLACTLDEEPTVKEASQIFKELAEEGDAYAQWVHGLNLISGTGSPADEKAGIAYIVKAAEGRFEGAIKWLSDAYAQGSHGFERNEAKAARWHKKLMRSDTIPY